MLSQKNLLSNALTLSKAWEFTASDILLHALPIYHTHGLFVATNIALVSGSQIRFLKKFDVDDIMLNLPSTTVMMGVPTFYTRLLTNNKFNKEITKNMRLFISGSAPLLTETHKEFENRTGHKILERYGMTETNMITSNPYIGERKENCYDLKIIFSELNEKFLDFNLFYQTLNCVDKNNNHGFWAHQGAGGRIVKFDEMNLLFTTGDFRNRPLAQNPQSDFGKILSISTAGKDTRVVSLGHRNPQGLYYSKKNNNSWK